MSLKENSSPRVIIFIIRCSPWIIKFVLTSWPIRDSPSWVRPYSTKSKRENFVSLSKANEGKTVALIGGQVSCVMTSPAEIARLGLPNANDRISDGYKLPNVEKRILWVRSNWQWSK